MSYLPSDFSARYAGGMVEPGAVFVRERLFDSAYADEYCRGLYGIEEFQAAVYSLYWTVFADNGVEGCTDGDGEEDRDACRELLEKRFGISRVCVCSVKNILLWGVCGENCRV